MLLPGKFHGLRSLVGDSPWGHKESDMTERLHLGFPVAQMVKRLPAMRETQVQSLGQEDPLEKEMATHSSTLALKNSMDRHLRSLVGNSTWSRKESDTQRLPSLWLCIHFLTQGRSLLDSPLKLGKVRRKRFRGSQVSCTRVHAQSLSRA